MKTVKVIAATILAMGMLNASAQVQENKNEQKGVKNTVSFTVGKAYSFGSLDGSEEAPFINHYAFDVRLSKKFSIGVGYTETKYWMRTIMEGSVDIDRRNLSLNANFIIDDRRLDARYAFPYVDSYFFMKAGISQHNNDDLNEYVATGQIGFGGHIYLTKHFALKGEVGLGSPFLAQTGLTFSL